MTTDSELPLPELSRRERLNILLMDIYSVGAYVIVTTLFMVAFFILFGLLAIPADVVAELVGRPVDPLLTIPLGAYPIVLTRELLRVSGFVAVFSGLYLIVHAATDRTFQSEVDDSVKEQTRRAVAVRAVYLRYLHNDG